MKPKAVTGNRAIIVKQVTTVRLLFIYFFVILSINARALAFTQEHFEQYPYAGDLFTHPFVQEKVAKYLAQPAIAPFVLVVSVKND